MLTVRSLSAVGFVGAAGLAVALLVPTDVQMPGTQPLEASLPSGVSRCDNCHGGYDPDVEPANWRGTPMAQAGRDPLFWATVAIAEQDFAGAGDLCIRCHAARGWLGGRSTPTDGSALTQADGDGVECSLCHAMVDPDESEHDGVQSAPYLAHDGGSPPTGFYGNGMYVIASGDAIHGPYAQTVARHSTAHSQFLRSSDFCRTCHDVSNPLVGDVAPGNGAQVPLPSGSFSGALGGPVTGKAAFLVEPHRYGAVERTSSEHIASALSTMRVAEFPTLPEELRDGILEDAYEAALLANRGGDYADGTERVFSCQSCHMQPTVGKGCDKNNAPIRPDLPKHELVGGNTWLHDVLLHLDAQGTLRFGPLTNAQRSAIPESRERARENLTRAAALAPIGSELRVVNLTGHKLLTGFPEGRRLWLNVQWRSAAGALLREDGAYGPVAVQLDGQTVQVDTIVDLDDPRLRIYEAHPGITQEWATVLLGAGVPATLPLKFDRVTGQPAATLGNVAAGAPGSAAESFHFVLNDRFLADTRIPPFGMDYDTALARSALPVPVDQYGDPGPGGTYRHWDEVPLEPPVGAAYAEIELLYQATSWEYVQFLHLANDRSVANLADTGRTLIDAWLATGMAAPETVATTTWCVERGTGDDFVLRTEVEDEGDAFGCRKGAAADEDVTLGLRTPDGGLTGALAAFVIQLYPAGAPPAGVAPGVWFDRTDIQLTIPGLPSDGVSVAVTIPPGLEGWALRVQGVALSTSAANGLYATTDAHDLAIR